MEARNAASLFIFKCRVKSLLLFRKYAGVIFVCVYVHMVVHIHICIVYMNVNILPVFPHFHFLLSLNQFVTIYTICFGIALKCEFLFYLVDVHFAFLCFILLCSLSYGLFFIAHLVQVYFPLFTFIFLCSLSSG